MKFVEKTNAEISAMNEQELAQYMKELHEDKTLQLKSAMENATDEKINLLKQELINLNDKRTEAITRALDAQGVAIERMAQKSEKAKGGSSSLLGDKKDELAKLKNQEQKWVTKSMTFGTNFPTYTGGTIDTDVALIPGARPFIQDVLSRRTMPASNAVIYYDQANRVGGAGTTAEGAAKNSNTYDLVETRKQAKKVTSITKVSQELIEDLPYMESVIREDLMMEVLRQADQQILNGDGVGANLDGIFTQATAFTAGSFAAAIDNANNYDVLTVAMSQVANNHFSTSHILLNPVDVAGMKLTKSSTGEYTMPAYVGANGMSISGVSIVENSGVPVGQYLVMDASKAEVYTRQALDIKIGYDSDDFSKNMVSVLAEWRGLVVIKTNNTGAFVKGVFATDKAALETI